MSRISRLKREDLLSALQFSGVTKAVVSFDGSGDSGSIDLVMCYDERDQRINPEDEIDWEFISTRWVDGAWQEESSFRPIPLTKALEDLCYDMLEQTGIDWYNNDGGFGELRINVTSKQIDLEVNTRYTQYETHNFNEDCKEIF